MALLQLGRRAAHPRARPSTACATLCDCAASAWRRRVRRLPRPLRRALARELAALDRTLSQRPATDDGWPTLLAGIDDQLSSIGVAFREVEDSPVAGDEETAVAQAWDVARESRARARRSSRVSADGCR